MCPEETGPHVCIVEHVSSIAAEEMSPASVSSCLRLRGLPPLWVSPPPTPGKPWQLNVPYTQLAKLLPKDAEMQSFCCRQSLTEPLSRAAEALGVLRFAKQTNSCWEIKDLFQVTTKLLPEQRVRLCISSYYQNYHY